MHTFVSEFKRLFIEKRFVRIYGVLAGLYLLLVIFELIAGNSDGISFWYSFLNNRLFTTFIPLFPVLINCGSFGDDVESRFINNIIIKTGFRRYFVNKYYATVITGGLLYFLLAVTTFCTSLIIFGVDINNKNLKNVIQIYLFNNNLFGGDLSINSLIFYILVVSSMMFILGAIYTSVGFLVSLHTNNKMLINGVSILSLRLYEDTVYTFAPLLGSILRLTPEQFYNRFSLFMYVGSYSDFRVIINSLILYVIILILTINKYKKLQRFYSGE